VISDSLADSYLTLLYTDLYEIRLTAIDVSKRFTTARLVA
jgi:hypothetical protein